VFIVFRLRRQGPGAAQYLRNICSFLRGDGKNSIAPL